jgi:hypothetical protein
MVIINAYQNNKVKAKYSYLADGTKTGVIGNNDKSFDYLGTFVYSV